MRPSLLRPPAPPKTVICGVTWMSVGPPPMVTMPGISSAVAAHERAVGMAVSSSLLIVVCRPTLCTSTIGVVPDTVTVSLTPPTARAASICAVNDPLNSMPSRFTWLNPGRENVTE